MSIVDTQVKVEVVLQGLPPGMIQQSKGLMAVGQKKNRTRDEEAELLAHWMPGKKKQHAIPWVAIYKSICEAAGSFKLKGKAASRFVAATIGCTQDMIPLITPGHEVYIEWVRIPPKTGACVQMGRPRFAEWSVAFTMMVDGDEYSDIEKILLPIIKAAGKLVGVGAWRPGLKGPYGRFTVEKFEIK